MTHLIYWTYSYGGIFGLSKFKKIVTKSKLEQPCDFDCALKLLLDQILACTILLFESTSQSVCLPIFNWKQKTGASMPFKRSFDSNPFGVWVKKLQVLFDTHTFSHMSYVSPFWNVLGLPKSSFEFFLSFTIICSILYGSGVFDWIDYHETDLKWNILVMFVWLQICWWFHLFDVILRCDYGKIIW